MEQLIFTDVYKDQRDQAKDYYQKKYSYFHSKLPKKCSNCGTTKELEIHHIVPLEFGGTNNISNMARLCHECHLKAHGKEKRTNAKYKRAGRPKIAKELSEEQIEDIYLKYFTCQIGKKECAKRLNCAVKSVGMNSYKKIIMDKYGIQNYRNNIDIRARLVEIQDNEVVGKIKIKGKKERIIKSKDNISWKDGQIIL